MSSIVRCSTRLSLVIGDGNDYLSQIPYSLSFLNLGTSTFIPSSSVLVRITLYLVEGSEECVFLMMLVLVGFQASLRVS